MSTQVSLRRHLMREMVLTLGAIALCIIILLYIGPRRVARLLSAKIIDQSMQQTQAELKAFFSPVIDELETMGDWAKEGVLDLQDPNGINLRLHALIKRHPEFSSLLVADDAGNAYLLMRTETGWLTRRTLARDRGSVSILTQWTSDFSQSAPAGSDRQYDPKNRPWYTGAMQRADTGSDALAGDIRETIHWTQPYLFHTGRQPGLTASMTVSTRSGKRIVVGINLLLKRITEFTQSLKILDQGEVAIASTKDRLIAMSHPERFGDILGQPISLIRASTGIEDTIYGRMSDVLRSRHDPTATGSGSISFSYRGNTWWTNSMVYPLNHDQGIRTAVLVPESDITGPLIPIRAGAVALLGLALLVGLVRAKYIALNISKPIEELTHQSNRIRVGNLDQGSPIASHIREVQILARSQEHMREGLKTLMKLREDLQLARQIQQGTLPQAFPRAKGYDLIGWNEPAEQTGGDTYDVVGINTTRGNPTVLPPGQEAAQVLFMLADATGHGVGPALSVTQLRAMMRISLRFAPGPGELIHHMNAQLACDLPGGRFITAWMGQLDTEQHTLTFFSAGQGPLLHYRANTDDWEELAADTVPLGILEEIPEFSPNVIELTPGDIYTVISDGIFEATNSSGEMFGTQRVQTLLRQNRKEPAQQLLDRLRQAVEAFTDGKNAEDDRTVVLIKRQ